MYNILFLISIFNASLGCVKMILLTINLGGIEMQNKSNYPVILIHGFLCWGTESKLCQFVPTFGMWHGNARYAISDIGNRNYAPHVGPFSSMWDRACILYAMIKGGTVDFGKVHSEKMGHARYGATYPGYVPDWGELDEAGKIKKIILVGHSFGGPTVRTLLHLLAEGDPDEVAGTEPSELSDLFKGGKQKWVHAAVTLAATHNGVTLPDAARPLVNPLATFLYKIGNATSGTWFAKFYDFNLDWYGFTSRDNHISLKEGKQKIRDLLAHEEDNIYYELSTTGGTACLAKTKTYDNIYYFSYYGRRTRRHGSFELPTRDMWAPFALFSIFECLYSDETHKGEEWQANDGLVNVAAAHHPIGQPFVEYSTLASDADIRPGIWNVMPQEWKDHTSYMGIGETDEGYNEFFKEMITRINNLPVIE